MSGRWQYGGRLRQLFGLGRCHSGDDWSPAAQSPPNQRGRLSGAISYGALVKEPIFTLQLGAGLIGKISN